MADNIIESLEYFEYRPLNKESYQEAGAEFDIELRNEDIVTQPCKSLLVIRGRLTASKTTTLLVQLIHQQEQHRQQVQLI